MIPRRLGAFTAVLLAMAGLGAPSLASAQVTDQLRQTHLPGIDGRDDRRIVRSSEWPWSAIGRVNVGGTSHCTGTLIGPRHVLTAAHCLEVPQRRRAALPTEVHFLAGYDRGGFLAHRRARALHRPEPWVERGAEARLADFAVIELDAPITDVRPLAILPLWRPDIAGRLPASPLAQAGYSKDRQHVLTLDADCGLVAASGVPDGAVLHDCDATRGDSGSPLLMGSGAQTRVVGINVAVRRDVASGERAAGIGIAAGLFNPWVAAVVAGRTSAR